MVLGIGRSGFLFILLFGLVVVPVLATDTVTVARYASGSTDPVFEESYTIAYLEGNLPVQGDGVTRYYLQGPIFDESEDPWNPDEDINCYPNKDMGAVRGTDVRDLCELAGGANRGDVIVIRAEDGFRKSFPYENVYTPPARQGRMVVAWEKDGLKAGAGYSDGMRLQFLADTSVNPWGEHIFGTSDMRAALPEEYWHYFQPGKPASTGLSVQKVSRVEIYTSSGGQKPVIPSGDDDGGADHWTPATGTLVVSSGPAGAAVVIDGAVSEYLTNVSIPDMPEGYYGVTVQREGYETPGEEWVQVTGGANATVSFSLTGITAPCTVISHPEGARIAVDGVDTGVTANGDPLSLVLGTHTITLSEDGYVPREITVQITADGPNRAEGVLVPLCTGGAGVAPSPGSVDTMPGGTSPAAAGADTTALSLGPAGRMPGTLRVATGAGFPGFIAGGESVHVYLPGGEDARNAGAELASYLFLSHGYDTAEGLPAEPQPALLSGGDHLVPRRLANALTAAGTVSQTCALFPSPSPEVVLENAGGAEDVFSLSGVVSLLASPGDGDCSYAVYEGCVPAAGVVCTVPADALPDEGTRSVTLLCTKGGEGGPDPVFRVNAAVPATVYETPVPGLVQVTAPLPSTGACTIAAEGDAPGWLVRVVIATAVSPSSGPDGTAADGSGTSPEETDGGLFAAIARFFASLFSWSAGDVPSPAGTPVPAGAGSAMGGTPLPAAPVPEMMADDEPAGGTAVAAPEAGTPTLTGGLFVETVPSDAWITLDGTATGKKSPALFAGLKEGVHRIGVSSSLTGDARSATAWVYPGAAVPVFFDFSRSLPETTVRVESGAAAPVAFATNGELPEVTTPAEVTVSDTNSFVAVTSGAGYRTYPLEYHRDPETLVLSNAACGACTVRVTSDPAGAEVILDGRRTGETTPAEIPCVSPGRHRVICSLPGYYPDGQVITVADRSGSPDAEVGVTFEPYSNGALAVTTEPAGAKLYLYDRYTGLVTPATIPWLPIGTYEIGLSTADETMVREVTVLPDTVTEYAFRFSEESVE